MSYLFSVPSLSSASPSAIIAEPEPVEGVAASAASAASAFDKLRRRLVLRVLGKWGTFVGLIKREDFQGCLGNPLFDISFNYVEQRRQVSFQPALLAYLDFFLDFLHSFFRQSVY